MSLIVIAHDIRSTYNVGSILRSSDGFGVERVYVGGVTPYPTIPSDTRLPHLANKLTKQIAKTALGAEKTMPITHYDNLSELVSQLKQDGFTVVALEQDASSVPLSEIAAKSSKIALLLGEEVEGIKAEHLKMCDFIAEIPMKGRKESFNVAVAAGIAMYAITSGN